MLNDITSSINSSCPGANAVNNEVEAGDGSINVDSASIVSVCEFLKKSEFEFNVLQVITGTDWGEYIEVSYVLASFTKNLELILKTKLDKSSSDQIVEIDSVVGVWSAADWQERECYDMMGVKFNNHPDMRRILCSEDWEGFPLRKDYEPAKEWHGFEIYPEAKMNNEDRAFAGRQKALEKEAMNLAKEQAAKE